MWTLPSAATVAGSGSSSPMDPRVWRGFRLRTPHNTLLKALARAFRWRELIETGTHATVHDLAKAEKINPSYASRILRLTLLAPEVVEAILDRRTAPETTLASLLKPFPIEWAAQTRKFSGVGSNPSPRPDSRTSRLLTTLPRIRVRGSDRSAGRAAPETSRRKVDQVFGGRAHAGE